MATMKAGFNRQGHAGIIMARAVEDQLMRDTWQTAGYDLLPTLRSLNVRTLVIAGEHDFMVEAAARSTPSFGDLGNESRRLTSRHARHWQSLGNSRSTTDDDLNSDTGVAKHGDEGIDTEPVDLASDKVADPWLGHAEQACSLSLGELPSLNQLAEPNHQICPDLEILSLFV